VRAGLLVYLTAGEAGRLLTGVSELSAPGSQLSFEHDPAATATLAGQARQMPALRPYASLWKGGLGADAPQSLAAHGWQPQGHDLAAVAAACGRPVPGPRRLPHRRPNGPVTAGAFPPGQAGSSDGAPIPLAGVS
jgi:O-methyltransferase involved in polyketide biosynthesis